MKILYLFLHHGCYSKAIENIKKRSKELGVDLLTPCLKEYSNQNESPKWVNDAKELVRLWLKKPD